MKIIRKLKIRLPLKIRIPNKLPLKSREARVAHAQQFLDAAKLCYGGALLIPIAALNNEGLESWLSLSWVSGLILAGGLVFMFGGILSSFGLRKLDAAYQQRPLNLRRTLNRSAQK